MQKPKRRADSCTVFFCSTEEAAAGKHIIRCTPFILRHTAVKGGEIMSVLGNILWLICFGWTPALLWALAGLLCCITVVGIPLGRACFNAAKLCLTPFGKEVIHKENRSLSKDGRSYFLRNDCGHSLWTAVFQVRQARLCPIRCWNCQQVKILKNMILNISKSLKGALLTVEVKLQKWWSRQTAVRKRRLSALAIF